MRHAFDIDPILGFETRVELNRNLVAFGEDCLLVDILMVWYLGEV